ncbi:hypothetical protein D3C73_1469530 [compost metagenome]
MPAPPLLATMRLSWMSLWLLRLISTPMQKLRISRPLSSTPRVSRRTRPGSVVVRTLVPDWPGSAPGQASVPVPVT